MNIRLNQTEKKLHRCEDKVKYFLSLQEGQEGLLWLRTQGKKQPELKNLLTSFGDSWLDKEAKSKSLPAGDQEEEIKRMFEEELRVTEVIQVFGGLI